ncbi:hypothetical protein A2U01_0072939, partial [Trifolium medium]|nr:hypothetical protein [Trifolium medium]
MVEEKRLAAKVAVVTEEKRLHEEKRLLRSLTAD